MLVMRPVSEGYVKLDDFFATGAQDEIKAMEADIREGMLAQSERTGRKIEFTNSNGDAPAEPFGDALLAHALTLARSESGAPRWVELTSECCGLFEFVLQQLLAVPFFSVSGEVFPESSA